MNCINSPNFFWRIDNFASVQKKVCPALMMGGLKWQLTFSQFMEGGVGKIRLILECLNASETLSDFEFKAEVRFVYDDGSHTNLTNATYNLKFKELCIWSYTISNFLKNYSNKENVTFLVIIVPAGRPENVFSNKKSVEDVDSKSLCMKSLIEDFGNLFNNDENSDFVLKCGERSFYVHKAVLSSRSDFFAGMFRSKMKEAEQGTGKIENLEPDILELVLRYLYTGKMPDLSREILQKVYAAADKFSLDPLKLKCYSLFVDDFITNFDNHSDKETKSDLQNVNVEAKVLKTESSKDKENKFLKEIFMTREWRLFSEEFPDKAQEMCKPYLMKVE